MTVALAVGLAGAVGAVARFLTDGFVQDRSSGSFPFGTLTVNGVGSFVLGVVTGLAWYHGLGGRAHAIVGVGFCGAFTTWSSVSWETVRLAEDGLDRLALVNMIGAVATALALAALGIVVVAVV
ncbi:MAG TPA: CrcB family protein [Acidimicrobiales bacterium]|nr:CrcB family protein [Acidimicrobiales bacterium]